MANGMYPVQDQCFVGTDQGPKCLQRLSADNKSLSWQEKRVNKAKGIYTEYPNEKM